MKQKKDSKNVKKEKTTVKVKKVNKTSSNSKIKQTKTIPIVEKIKKFAKNNIYDIALAVLSIIALIIGTFAIGFKKAFVIVVLLDIIIWFLPVISFVGNKSRRKNKSQRKKS